jgi:hypothetical protein
MDFDPEELVTLPGHGAAATRAMILPLDERER